MINLGKIKRFLVECSLKNRMFYTILGICIIESGCAFVSAVIAGLSSLAIAGTLLCMVSLWTILFYTIKSGNALYGSVMTCLAIALFLPYNYLVSGGMNSGVPMYFVCGSVLIGILLPNGRQGLFSVIYLALCSLLFIYEYYQPEIIMHYNSARWLQAADIMMSFWITSLLMYWCVNELLVGRERERIKTLKLNTRLKEQTMYDYLTEVYNRTHLMKLLDKFVVESVADDKQLAVVMFDIDFFKRVNDTCGHLAGDRVLHETAALIKKAIAAHGFVGRYGGEEFIAVLPSLDKEAAYNIAEAVRKEIASQITAGDISVTISGGVSMLTEETDNINKLIAAADANLYKAKQNGRNQIIG